MSAATVSDLFSSHPTVRSPVSGYHVVAGSYSLAQLIPGTVLPTVDVVRNSGQPDTPVTLQITAPRKVSGCVLTWVYHVCRQRPASAQKHHEGQLAHQLL